ncbi:MAG: RNA chaperone Hfq [Gammaproteobacteria bacterium]|nr:RNA chaperone Hfq [Gammaproteobacteria bacterium]
MSLQDAFLKKCQKENFPVHVFLVSGVKLNGRIDSFDQYAIFLKNGSSQLIYKHQISTVLPAR